MERKLARRLFRDLQGIQQIREGFALVEGGEAERAVGGVH
jgi:hypothetical protein